MSRELELARSAVRARAQALKLATQAGRAELRSAGAISEEAWLTADRCAGELTEALGELERCERSAVRR